MHELPQCFIVLPSAMSNESMTELVISQVKSRPVLWDKKHEMYGNIQAMDYEWNKLSVLLKRDKEFLKKRWRRVRDVFRIEMKKFKPPENPTQPLMSYYGGIWPHFENMLFLKDSLTKRIPRLFFPEENDETFDTSNDTTTTTATTSATTTTTAASNVEAIINEPSETLVVYEEASPETFDDVDEEFEEKPLLVNGERNCEENRSDSKPWSEEQNEPRGVKRKADDWELVDEDINFAKSIVGYLKRLNPIKKLMVRNEIQTILLRELVCDSCKCNSQQKACKC